MQPLGLRVDVAEAPRAVEEAEGRRHRLEEAHGLRAVGALPEGTAQAAEPCASLVAHCGAPTSGRRRLVAPLLERRPAGTAPSGRRHRRLCRSRPCRAKEAGERVAVNESSPRSGDASASRSVIERPDDPGMRQSVRHDPGDAAPLPGDLLLQAVEGMERPLFVLDDDWRFRYMNPAGAACWTDRRRPGRPGHLGGVPGDARQPVRARLPPGRRRPAEPASFEAWYEPLQIWFQVDAFRTDAGLVVTYDDVTERRRTEEERAAAVAAREAAAAAAAAAAAEAEQAGRHLMLLGDINLAMTSTFDTDEAVDRFAHLVVPAAGRLVPGERRRPRRHPPRRRPGAPRPGPGRRDAPLRRPAGGVATCATAPVPTAAARPPAGGHPATSPTSTSTAMVAERRGARGARSRCGPPPSRPSRWSRGGRSSARSPWSTVPSAGAHTAAELRTAEIASRRAALALDNARLAAANQQVAERLQLSLLSPPRAARPPRARRPVPAGDAGRVDRRRLVRRLPAARRRHGAGHRRRHGARHRGRRGDGPGQDAGPGHRLRPAGGAGRGAAPGRPRAGRAGGAGDGDGAGLPGRAGRRRAGGRAAPAALVDGGPSRPDAAAGRRHGHRPRGAGRPAAGHRLARAARRRSGAAAGGQHAAAVHRRAVRAAGRARWTRAARRSATSSAGRPTCRWTRSATGCSPRCWGRASRTTSPSSPCGRTRWTSRGRSRPARSSCRRRVPRCADRRRLRRG